MTASDYLLQRTLDPFSSRNSIPLAAVFNKSNNGSNSSVGGNGIFSRLISYDSLNLAYDINRIAVEKSSTQANTASLNSHLSILEFHLQTQFKIFPSQCHFAAVNCLDLEKIDYEYLISGSNDGKIKLWNVNQVEVNDEAAHHHHHQQQQQQQQQQLDTDSASGYIGTGNKTNRNHIAQIGEIWSQFPDDDDLSTNNHTAGNTNSSGNALGNTWRGHNYGISSVKWWPFDTGMFISSSFDKTIKLWDTENLKLIYTFNNDKIMPTSIPEIYTTTRGASAPLASASNYGNSKMFGQIYSTDFTPTLQHALLAIASQGTSFVKLLDLRSMTLSSYLFGHHDPSVTSVSWNPIFANVLATGSNDGEVNVWDIRRSDSCLYSLNMYDSKNWDNTKKPKSATYHNGGSRSSSSSTSSTSSSYGKAHHNRAVNGLCWLNNGAELVSVGLDNCVKLWDLQNFEMTNIVGNKIMTKDARINQLKRQRKLNRKRRKLGGAGARADSSGNGDGEEGEKEEEEEEEEDINNPTIRNNFLQTINPIVSGTNDGVSGQYLVYPSNKISIFDLSEYGGARTSANSNSKTSRPRQRGTLFKTLKRTDLHNQVQLEERACCIVEKKSANASSSNSSSTVFFTGTSNGRIDTWGPSFSGVLDQAVDGDDDYSDDEDDGGGGGIGRGKKGEYFNGIYIPKT